MIRAYDPWPGTSTHWLQAPPPLIGRLLKIFPPTQAIVGPPSTSPTEPGTVAIAPDSSVTVQTGEGQLKLLSVQVEGKRRMDTATFLTGNPLSADTLLGTNGSRNNHLLP